MYVNISLKKIILVKLLIFMMILIGCSIQKPISFMITPSSQGNMTKTIAPSLESTDFKTIMSSIATSTIPVPSSTLIIKHTDHSLTPTMPPTLIIYPQITGQIAFVNWGPVGDGIDIISPNGNDWKRLTADPTRFYSTPSWSPDGRWIVFSSAPGPGNPNAGVDHLFIMKSDGTELKQLTFGPLASYRPAWSPDGENIAYIESDYSSPTGPYNIDMIYPDGTNWRQLSTRSSIKGAPVWSSDGKFIAYVSVDGINKPGDLYIMQSDGKNSRKIEGINPGGYQIAWSPDMSQIIYKSEEDCNLYTVNIDNSKVKRLTYNLARAANPTWSPDGRIIAFDGADTPCQSMEDNDAIGWQIYLMNSDGSGMEKMTSSSQWYPLDPSWSPVPGLQSGTTYSITKLGKNLNLRIAPSLKGKTLLVLPTDTKVSILDGPVKADDYYWWKMRTEDGVEGWAVDVYGWYKKLY